MICPLRIDYTQITGDHNDVVDYRYQSCVTTNCSWWDSKANYNPETKQYEGQCCILTLSRLKISGGINTHAY